MMAEKKTVKTRRKTKKQNQKNVGGRPPFEITDAVLLQAESLAAQGMTQEQIAEALGIVRSTLQEKKKEYSDFSDAIKRGQAKGIATITNALFVSGTGGNITAQIFYLKNRAGWRDKQDIEHFGDMKVTVLQDDIDALSIT